MKARMPTLAAVLCFAVTGCWTGGQVRYRESPDLARVTLATGEKQPTAPENLGVVRTRAAGYQSCDSLVTQSLHDLLEESHALGGAGVRDVKFRQRWHWSGREPICRRQFLPPFRLVVEAQGLAVK